MSERGAFNGPVPILLAIAAVIGWGFALYAFNSQSNLQVELMRQNKAVGTLTSLRDEVTTLTAETERLTGERDVVGAEMTELQAALADLQGQIATTEGEIGQKQSDLSALTEQLSPLRDEIAGFDTARVEAEERLAATSQELADVGGRLAEARKMEAEVQKQLSSLTEQAARLTAESSEAEKRVQAARDAEASLQSTLDTATAEFQRMTSERDALVQGIDEMTQRRDRLAAENAAAAEQRHSVQAIVTQLSDNLAARSQQLAEVERRLSELQGQTPAAADAPDAGDTETTGGAAPEGADNTDAPEATNPAAEGDSAGILLQPGSYTVGPLAVTFAEDGGFVLRNEVRDEEITGSYVVEEGKLTLSDAEGAVGTTPFPMTCALGQSDQGLTLEQSGDEPCALAGLELARQE